MVHPTNYSYVQGNPYLHKNIRLTYVSTLTSVNRWSSFRPLLPLHLFLFFRAFVIFLIFLTIVRTLIAHGKWKHNFFASLETFYSPSNLCGQWLWVLIDWLDNDQIPLKTKKIFSMVFDWECCVVKYCSIYQDISCSVSNK